MRLTRSIVLLTLLALTACGDRDGGAPAADGGDPGLPRIVAANYPLYFFARTIAGDSVEVLLPDMEGDPAFWRPDSEAIAMLQSADLVVLNGAGYESWLGWATLPGDRLLDSSAGFADRLIPLEGETVHQHGPEGEHSHAGVAFTVWLDPELAAEQAAAIERAVSALAPENAERHRARLSELEARLEALDRDLRDAFQALGGRPVVFSHPVYQYLARRYALNGASVHWEPDEAPGMQAMLELREVLRAHPARLMLWEDTPLAATAAELQKLEISSVPFLTASNRPDGGDYFDVMQANIERLLLQ